MRHDDFGKLVVPEAITHKPPAYEVKIKLNFGFSFADKFFLGMSQVLQKIKNVY